MEADGGSNIFWHALSIIFNGGVALPRSEKALRRVAGLFLVSLKHFSDKTVSAARGLPV